MRNLCLNPVFDGFDVVIGGRFNLFDLLAVLQGEICVKRTQKLRMFTANREDSGKSGLRKGDKPLDFDLDTGSHESVFGENFPQFVTLFGIATVQGTDGAQRRKFRHGRLEKKR